MKRRENAILLGIGATRRKFYTTNSNPGEVYVKIPAIRYVANASGKLCRGNGNHKCLFNKGDNLEVLCPETVVDDGHAMLFVHRAWNGKDMLMQRYLSDYTHQLEFKEECVLEFKVTQVGHFTCGGFDDCVCIQPIPGTNLWIDKKLALQPENMKTQELKEENMVAVPEFPLFNGFFENEYENTWGYGYEYNPFYENGGDNDFI